MYKVYSTDHLDGWDPALRVIAQMREAEAQPTPQGLVVGPGDILRNNTTGVMYTSFDQQQRQQHQEMAALHQNQYLQQMNQQQWNGWGLAGLPAMEGCNVLKTANLGVIEPEPNGGPSIVQWGSPADRHKPSQPPTMGSFQTNQYDQMRNMVRDPFSMEWVSMEELNNRVNKRQLLTDVAQQAREELVRLSQQRPPTPPSPPSAPDTNGRTL